MRKRVFAMIMAAALCVGLLPTNVLAEEEQPASEEEAIEIAETDGSVADDLEISTGETSEPISISSAEDEASEEPEVEGETTLTYEGRDYLVTVTYADGAEFPAGAELKVSEYDKNSKTYLDRYEEAAELYGWNEEADEDSEEAEFDAETMLDVRLFKIELDAPDENGEMEPVEPDDTIQTTITYLSAEDEEDGYMVTYFGDDEEDTESLDTEVTEEDDDHNITFETDELSDFMVAGISEEDYGIMTLASTAAEGYFDFISTDATLSAHHGSGVFEPDSGVDYIADNGNYFHIIESGTNHVTEEHRFDLNYSTLDKNNLPTGVSLEYIDEANTHVLLLDISSVANGDLDTFDKAVAGDGYTFHPNGTLTFNNAGTIAGGQSVDVLITLDDIRLYNSYSSSSSYGSSVKLPTDQKFAFGNTGTGDTQFWISENYISDRATAFGDGEVHYSYPVNLDVNMTIKVVLSDSGDEVDMSFLMAASDLDGCQKNVRNGYYAETFKTLSGFNGNYYIYPTDADNIASYSKGVVTAQAVPNMDNLHDDDSYTLGGIYADTESGEWKVGYSEGFCGTRVEVYDYTSNDITIQKEDIEDSSILLDGAEFIVYKDVEPGDPDYPYDVGDTNYGETVTIYYKNEQVTSSGTVLAAEWSTNKDDAKKFTTGDDDEGIVVIRCLYPNDNYYLEEVTAPAGYQLLNDPIKFELTSYGTIVCDDKNVTVDNDTLTLTVTDVPVKKDIDADGDGEYGDSGKQVNVGDTVEYKIDYTNGHDTEATIKITDVLDEGLDFVEASNGGTYDEATRTVAWEFTEKAGVSGSVTFKATVNETALIKNEIKNTATVQVDNDYAVETEPVYTPVPGKDVDVPEDGETEDEKFGDSGDEVEVGDTLTYKIEYQNSYDDPATVTITDVLDIGLDFVSASDGGTYDEGTRTITWVLEEVAPHSEEGYYVTFTATVNSDALTKNEITNDATVKVNEDSIVTNEVDNPVPEKDEDVDPEDDHEYGDSGRAVEVGTKITFTIKYRNSYDDPANVVITDVLDEGLTYVDDSATDGGVYDEETRTITWTISNVAAHTSGSVQFTAKVNENALTEHQVENKATVQIGDHPAKDTNTVYNPVTSKDVDIDPEDGLVYGDNGKQVNIGDTLTYIVYYTNSYDDPATVTITDVLDEGLDFVSADNGGTYDDSTRTITWTLKDVPGREDIKDELYVTFVATVNENALVKHEVDNTATVQVNDDPSVQTNTVYNPVPEKDVDSDGDGKFGDSGELVQIGDTLTYQIDYFNGYDVAADVVITDTLDPGLTYVSSDPAATYDESTRTLTWELPGVEAHKGGSVTFKATANSDALETFKIDNVAYVQVGDDPAVETNKVDNEILVIEVSGEKIWDDSDNVYSSRPESITIHLLADGEPAKDYDGNEITATVEPDAEGKWTWTFTNLPKYKTVVDGTTGETTKTEITYTVTEDAIPDYTLDGITGDMNDGFVITNKLVEPKITKRVHEDDYQRKEDSGEHMHDGEDTDGDGEGTWDDADNKQEVTYHLKVTEIKDVLNLTIHDYLEDGLDFEPNTVEISLYDNGVETELVEGTDFIVTQGDCSDPDCAMDGCTFEIKFEDNSLFANVSSDAYLAVTYKALTDTHEEDYDDYEDDILNATYMTYGDYDLQTLSGMRRSAVAYAETDLFGFGIYKYSIEDGEEVALANAEFILERDGVYATFEVEYDEDTGEQYYMVSGWEDDASAAGTLISGEDGVIRIDGLDDDTYTITETKAPTGYEIVDETITVVIDEDGNVTVDGDTGSKEVVTGHEVNVENSLILTSVEGTKTWDDEDNQDGKRPESITINLLADGEVIDTQTVTEADGWSWSFTDLPMYKSGVEIQYTITEVAVPDYSTEYSGYDVKNTHTPGKTSVTVVKAWDDQDDADGIRPESVTVELYKNGEATGDTLILSADNNWTGSFTELDEYTDGVKNEYTVKEDAVEGYATEITGDAESGYVITNTHTPPEKGVDTDGDGTFEDDGELVHVGDELTYQIKYYNYKDEAATVTITDTLDYALDFVSADNGGTYDESTRTITWTIKDAPAQEWGTVTFKVKVNDVALLEEQIENTATVKIGDDKAIDTNVVKNPTPDSKEGEGQPGTTGGRNGGPKTGDTNNIALWLALIVAAMAAVIVALRMRKRKS